MEIRKVALIGAGAVGAYFICQLDGAEGVDFTLIAEGARKERLERDGIRINGQVRTPRVSTPGEAGPQDLVLISTKHGALPEVLEYLPQLVGPDTLVLSLLNGVDSEEKIARVIGWEHVVYSLMRISARRANGEITFKVSGYQGVFFGIPSAGPAEKEKLDRLAALFTRTGIEYYVMEDILTDMWLKYASNISNNLPQAVIGATAGMYSVSAHGKFLAQKLWSETRAVAAARGITLDEEVLIFPGASNGAKYSTLQDLEAGRHTEVDMFLGELMRMAGESGVVVPCCEYVYHAIKAIEEKNDGLF